MEAMAAAHLAWHSSTSASVMAAGGATVLPVVGKVSAMAARSSVGIAWMPKDCRDLTNALSIDCVIVAAGARAVELVTTPRTLSPGRKAEEMSIMVPTRIRSRARVRSRMKRGAGGEK